MFMSKKRFFGQRGDTIIEVMLAVVALSLVVGGTYSIAVRNLRAGRQAQERGEAVKIAESQLENIKSKAAEANDPNLYSASNFCFNPTNTITSGNCTFNNRYRVSINSVPSSVSQQFTVVVEWDSIGSVPTENVTVYYRVLDET